MTTPTHKRMVGDTLLKLNGIAYLNDDPYDWATAGITAKFETETDDGTSVVSATATGMTAHPTQTWTADATNDFVVCNAHGVQNGDQVVLSNSGGALPAGTAASTRYYCINRTPNNFQISTLPNGTKVDITGAGTGTHSFYVVGSYQKDFTSGEAGTVRHLRGWASAWDGSSEIATFPNDAQGIPIEIVSKGQ